MTTSSPVATTIFARSSAPGRAGVAVVRASGPLVPHVLEALTGKCPKPREARLSKIVDPATGEELDQGLVLYFKAPHSFTGEDVGEFHLHGSPAVVKSLLRILAGFANCRMAEAGEFTRRAFENGKLDLTAAEGLADLIDAETEAQRKQALRQSSGALGRLYEGWREMIVEASALVEAAIDFSDEADVSESAFDRAREIIRELKAAIDCHLADNHRGEILREGLRVVLTGAPNAGKSSVLNALARREAAIVSEEAGTTRDVIEVHLDLKGLPVIVADTAGIRTAGSKIEQEGIRRTHERAEAADLVIWLIDATAPLADPPAGLTIAPERLLRVLNKADLADTTSAVVSHDLAISATTGAGIETLIDRIGAIASERIGLSEGPVITQVRHRQLVSECARHLADYLAGESRNVELRAEELRLAASALGRITGRVDVEEVLERIFSRFCIGK
jgi:tRNA modification GTPase